MNFPSLKTSAVAQYPASRVVAYRNQTVRFVDGSEQRYRDCAGALHRWIIRLDLLDEGEAAELDSFLVANQGRFGSFAFTDPWDGKVYTDCSLAGDDLVVTVSGEMKRKTSVTVVENRG
jgi:hypothetical protein